ncbi:MAG TPA: IS200/IS605 family transposase [Oligoflexus sp.]|uniref:IS200/IS605 family transposase n=1 Tax=Oligoflexus sp. TaxID=1971216 RepID=UPI002D7057FB|nr:IS200/IS605 family transposase [Oligoflexus sp.]HYX32114.1 IS200/IS605 family transposase [Oligoflexus sp.]
MKKHQGNVVNFCTYHVVWVTKYRKKYLAGEIGTRLKQICRDVANECSIEIKEIECDGDTIRLLLDVDPQFGVHKAVKRMKGISSKVLRQEFAILRQRLPTLWTNSYFVCTVGRVSSALVRQYIELQKERIVH